MATAAKGAINFVTEIVYYLLCFTLMISSLNLQQKQKKVFFRKFRDELNVRCLNYSSACTVRDFSERTINVF